MMEGLVGLVGGPHNQDTLKIEKEPGIGDCRVICSTRLGECQSTTTKFCATDAGNKRSLCTYVALENLRRKICEEEKISPQRTYGIPAGCKGIETLREVDRAQRISDETQGFIRVALYSGRACSFMCGMIDPTSKGASKVCTVVFYGLSDNIWTAMRGLLMAMKRDNAIAPLK